MPVRSAMCRNVRRFVCNFENCRERKRNGQDLPRNAVLRGFHDFIQSARFLVQSLLDILYHNLNLRMYLVLLFEVNKLNYFYAK